ncbi:hypothetical protein EON65_47470 [archaeon]|nr:MAG: hypothetical protein EON65_47470 [archaeon]
MGNQIMGRDDEDDEEDEDYREDDGPPLHFGFRHNGRRISGDNRGTMENPISLVDDDEVELVYRGPRPAGDIIDLTAEEDGGEQLRVEGGQQTSSSSSSSSNSSSTITPVATEAIPSSSSSSSSSMAITTFVASFSVDADSGEIRRVRRRLT